MSIVPVNDGQGRESIPSSALDLWDPFALDLWEPFRDFPFPLGATVNTRLDWKETSRADVWKVVLPGFTDEDVLVELQDGRILQVSVESGNFMSRFKIPDDANLEGLKANMNHGVLVVTIPKYEPRRNDVRVVEISGE